MPSVLQERPHPAPRSVICAVIEYTVESCPLMIDDEMLAFGPQQIAKTAQKVLTQAQVGMSNALHNRYS
jgi:hypothetical protein